MLLEDSNHVLVVCRHERRVPPNEWLEIAAVAAQPPLA
jgi:hypothetical protein